MSSEAKKVQQEEEALTMASAGRYDVDAELLRKVQLRSIQDKEKARTTRGTLKVKGRGKIGQVQERTIQPDAARLSGNQRRRIDR